MGRLFTVYFDENQHHCFCEVCGTHIALWDHLFYCSTNIFAEENGTFFINAVNVQVDRPVHYQRVGVHTVAEIFCVNCGDTLGWKCIQVDKDQKLPLDCHALREGNVKLITRVLVEY